MQNKSEMINRIAELEEENAKLNAIIDGYQPKIQALKDENERLKEENFNFEGTLCEEGEKYKQTLQEIKEIAERQMRCCTCNFQKDDYKNGCKTCESKYAREIAVEILQILTKAEEK